MFYSLALASITTTMTFDWGAIVTALAPTIAIIVTWYYQRKTHKVDTQEIKQSVGEVHTLVNGKNDALLAKVAALEAENRALKAK